MQALLNSVILTKMGSYSQQKRLQCIIDANKSLSKVRWFFTADTHTVNYDVPNYVDVFVAAVRYLWQNRTDKFGQCSVVELLIKSDSY